MSPRDGETSEAARLRRQLEEMQRSFEEANAARETAMEELKTTKRQVELAEATRQLHDAEGMSRLPKRSGGCSPRQMHRPLRASPNFAAFAGPEGWPAVVARAAEAMAQGACTM